MRLPWAYGLALTLLLGAGLGTVQADPTFFGSPAGGPTFIFNFDEAGNGSFQIFNPGTGMYGPLTPSPGSVMGGVLTYQLPGRVVPGDVVATQPDTGGRQISDVVRFSNMGTTGPGLLQYFSDDPGEAGEEAFRFSDIGIPQLGPDFDIISEVLFANGGDGFNAAANVNGGTNPATTNFFNGISDAAPVPEPGSVALMGLGLGFVGLYWAVRRRRSAT